MSETMYKKYFEDANPLIECDCSKCDKKYECADSNLSESCKQMQDAIKKYNETCPEGSIPRSGQCAKKDNSGYVKGKCDKGFIFDPASGSIGKCIRHTDK